MTLMVMPVVMLRMFRASLSRKCEIQHSLATIGGREFALQMSCSGSGDSELHRNLQLAPFIHLHPLDVVIKYTATPRPLHGAPFVSRTNYASSHEETQSSLYYPAVTALHDPALPRARWYSWAERLRGRRGGPGGAPRGLRAGRAQGALGAPDARAPLLAARPAPPGLRRGHAGPVLVRELPRAVPQRSVLVAARAHAERAPGAPAAPAEEEEVLTVAVDDEDAADVALDLAGVPAGYLDGPIVSAGTIADAPDALALADLLVACVKLERIPYSHSRAKIGV
mmetsp:Transcript_86501/g.253185  ORF Transcript_86501/g.253185 Transcript_86501/m.253185 type:complete len:282 (-) Transcript_86501:322-1167(-)